MQGPPPRRQRSPGKRPAGRPSVRSLGAPAASTKGLERSRAGASQRAASEGGPARGGASEESRQPKKADDPTPSRQVQKSGRGPREAPRRQGWSPPAPRGSVGQERASAPKGGDKGNEGPQAPPPPRRGGAPTRETRPDRSRALPPGEKPKGASRPEGRAATKEPKSSRAKEARSVTAEAGAGRSRDRSRSEAPLPGPQGHPVPTPEEEMEHVVQIFRDWHRSAPGHRRIWTDQCDTAGQWMYDPARQEPEFLRGFLQQRGRLDEPAGEEPGPSSWEPEGRP